MHFRLASVHSFIQLFSVYQRLIPYAEPPNLAVLALAACRDQLNARHIRGRGRWGRETLGNTTRWVPVHQEEWPWCTLRCPYSIACEELELTVGQRYEHLSSRRGYEERLSLTTDAGSLTKHGLLAWKDATETCAADFECGTSSTWRKLHWVGNAGLNEVFEAMACADIESVRQALIGWLENIDAGCNPAMHTFPGRRS